MMNFPLKGKTPVFNAGRESFKTRFKRSDVHVPDVSIVFSPMQPPIQILELFGEVLDKLLVSMNCMKSRSQPGGFFSFTIVDDPTVLRTFRLPWRVPLSTMRDMFPAMTLVQLWIDGLHVMTGFVVKANRGSQGPGSAPTVTVEVSELGNLYSESIMAKQLQLYGDKKNIFGDIYNQMHRTLGALSGIPLPQAVYLLCKAFWESTLVLPRGYPDPWFKLSDGVPTAARMVAAPPPLGCISQASILQTLIADVNMYELAGGSSFWEFLKHMVQEPFCEFYTESGGRTMCTGRLGQGPPQPSPLPGAESLTTRAVNVNVSVTMPGLNYVVLRSTPFDNPLIGWTAFKQTFPFTLGVYDLLAAGDFVMVDDRDVISKDLSRGMIQQYNVFQCRITAGSGSNSHLPARPSVSAGPINPFAPGGVRTFPMRLLDVTVDGTSTARLGYAAQKLETSDRLQQELVLNNLLNIYHRNNHKMLNGPINVGRFLPHARPGMLLLYMRPPPGTRDAECLSDLGMYYIDNVSHDMTVGGAATTSLSVIRGTPAPETAHELHELLFEWETGPVTPEYWDYPRL